MDICGFYQFDGTCREAIELYVKILNGKMKIVKTYGDLAETNAEMPEKYKDRIALSYIKGDGKTWIFSDYPPGKRATGCSGSLFLIVKSAKKFDRLHAQLGEYCPSVSEPTSTGWSKRVATMTDKFGFQWCIALENKKMWR